MIKIDYGKLIRDWVSKNPKGSKKQCAADLKIPPYAVRVFSYKENIVFENDDYIMPNGGQDIERYLKEWIEKAENPSAFACSKELDYDLYLLAKYTKDFDLKFNDVDALFEVIKYPFKKEIKELIKKHPEYNKKAISIALGLTIPRLNMYLDRYSIIVKPDKKIPLVYPEPQAKEDIKKVEIASVEMPSEPVEAKQVVEPNPIMQNEDKNHYLVNNRYLKNEERNIAIDKEWLDRLDASQGLTREEFLKKYKCSDTKFSRFEKRMGIKYFE